MSDRPALTEEVRESIQQTITPEMIEAGKAVLSELEREVSSAFLVAEIYRAMVAASAN